jgi:hypothetical protein
MLERGHKFSEKQKFLVINQKSQKTKHKMHPDGLFILLMIFKIITFVLKDLFRSIQ